MRAAVNINFKNIDYNPEIGRFLSEEPTGIDGPNLYWYTKNNPVNYVDPNGLWVIGGGFGGAGGVGTAGIGPGGTLGGGFSGGFVGSSKCGGLGAGGFTSNITEGNVLGAFLGYSGGIFVGFGDVEDIQGDFETSGIVIGPVTIEIGFNSDGEFVGFGISGGPGIGGGTFSGKGNIGSKSTSDCECP